MAFAPRLLQAKPLPASPLLSTSYSQVGCDTVPIKSVLQSSERCITQEETPCQEARSSSFASSSSSAYVWLYQRDLPIRKKGLSSYLCEIPRSLKYVFIPHKLRTSDQKRSTEVAGMTGQRTSICGSAIPKRSERNFLRTSKVMK